MMGYWSRLLLAECFILLGIRRTTLRWFACLFTEKAFLIKLLEALPPSPHIRDLVPYVSPLRMEEIP